MERRIALVFAACILFGSLGGFLVRVPAAADEQVPPEAPQPARKSTRIAIVDLGKVFKESQQFKSAREVLTADATKSEAEAKNLAIEVRRLENALQQLPAGSNEHDAAADELAIKKQTFESFRKQAQRYLAKAESNLYVKLYEIARKKIETYSAANGIDLVMRFNADEPDSKAPKTPEKILEALNRQVVYQNGLDITEQIIQAMNSPLASTGN